MPYSKDLELSPKFSKYLAQQGLLIPIVNAYEDYRKLQNFPFEIKDKRVFRTAILKALCGRTDLTIADVEMTADKWVDEMYELYPTAKLDPEMEKILKQYKIPEALKDSVMFIMRTLDKKSFDVWIKNAAKGFATRNAAESTDSTKVKVVQNKKLNKEMSDKLNVIAAKHNANTTKKSVKVTKK